MRSVLVTGCSGYIGAEVALWLHRHQWRVFGLDKVKPRDEEVILSCDFQQGDLAYLSEMSSDVDVIVHLAGASYMSDDGETDFHVDNVLASRRLRMFYSDTPIFYLSTTAVYDAQGRVEPQHIYSATKLTAENYADRVTRCGTVCGANYLGDFHTPLDCMVYTARNHNRVFIDHPMKVRPLVTLDALCDIILMECDNMLALGRGAGIPVSDLLNVHASMGELGRAVVDFWSYAGLGSQVRCELNAGLTKLDKDLRKNSPAFSTIVRGTEANSIPHVRLAQVIANTVIRHRRFIW